MDSISVRYAVGYHGTPLHYVNDQTALAICGNSICSYSLIGGASAHLFWGQGSGISTSAYHAKTNRVAYAEKGLQPAVYIHDLTTNKLFAKLTGVADLEITALAFSIDGSRLFTAAREPDFRLVLWDLTLEEPSKLAEESNQWLVQYASFSPATADYLCISGFGKFAIWMFEQTFHRNFFSSKVLQADPFRPHCHSWAPTGDAIYVGGMNGEILLVNTKVFLESDVVDGELKQPSLQELLEEDSGSTYSMETFNKHNRDSHPEWTVLLNIQTIQLITSVCVGEQHIVVVSGGGILKWFFVGDLSQDVNKNSTSDKKACEGSATNDENTSHPDSATSLEIILLSELDLGVPDIVTAQYSAITGKLLLGSHQNYLAIVHVDIQRLKLLIHDSSTLTTLQLQQSCRVEWQNSFHSGPILGLNSLGSGKFIITCGQDGTVRVWETDRGRELFCQCFRDAQTCIDSKKENNMVICGSISGDICMMKVDVAGRLAIVFQDKLHPGSLEKISFNSAGSNIVAVSKLDGKLFFLRTGASELDELDFLGYALLKDSILDIAWDTPPLQGSGIQDVFVLVSLAKGEIVKLKVPATRASDGGLCFENKILRRISFCIAIPLLAIVVGKYYLEKEGVERKVLWGLGQDRKLQQYRLPDSLQAWTGPDGIPLPAHFNIPAHSKPGSAIVLCEEKSVLLTGAKDGVLQLRTMVLDPLRAPVKVRDVHMYDGYTGGITCITVAGGKIFTAGANGVIFSCLAMEAAVQEADQSYGNSFFPTKDLLSVEKMKHSKRAKAAEPYTPSMLEKREQTTEARSSLAGESYKAQMRNQIQIIKEEFSELFEKNKKAPELEQLSRLELIVDLDLEAQLRLVGQKQIDSALQQVRLENAKKEILAERIKHECWGKMSEPGSYLWPFIQGCEVSNFPKHGDRERHIRLANVAKILRIIAIQENMYIRTNKLVVAGQPDNALNIPTAPGSSQSSLPDVPANEGVFNKSLENNEFSRDQATPESAGAPLVEAGSVKLDENLASRRSSAIVTRESSGGKSGSDQDNATRGSSKGGLESTSPLPTPDEDQEETIVNSPEMQEKGPVGNLLFNSFDLISSKRKRMQRLLLHMHLLEVRDKFNLKLEETRLYKKDILEKIKEMTSRIKELQRLLGQKDELTIPTLEHVENLQDIFEIKDEEISFRKPVTKEERLEEARRLEEEQLRIKQGGNVVERALQDMMGGKLEKPEEEVVVEAQIEKPAWMSGNPKSFTKEQLKEIKEFEAKLKAKKEEKEKKVRAQEAEQRKLKSDIQDLMTAFDKLVMDLYNMHLMEEAKCIEIEEEVARLSIEIEEEEVLDEQKEEDLATRLEQLKAAKGQSVSTLTEFKREVDDFREHCEEGIQEDKSLDRNFKKDFADCGDLVSLLYKHFRRRRLSPPKQSPSSPKPSPMQDAKPSLERLKSVKATRVRNSIMQGRQSVLMAKITPSDPYNERPEDIEPDIWHRLVVARDRKILKEEEVKKNANILSGMLSYLNKLTTLDEANRKRIEKALRALAEFRESRDKKKKNLAFLLHVKQGLVEVELQPLEGNYSDAVLLPRSVVLEFNDVVLREANSKIDILVAIKDFRKNIYLVQWENQRLQIVERNLTEKIRLIQLLRNTKALQMVIKNGEDFANASESLAIENRMEHNRKLHEKRVYEKACHLQQLVERKRKFKEQSCELQKEATKLHQEYTFQQQVCQKSLGHESKDAALKERMFTLFTKRVLREQGTLKDSNKALSLSQ